jgi:hypothetical protein
MSTQLHPALKMTYAQKMERNAQKRATLLDFLASGESYTTLSIVADLLRISERTAQLLLKKLVQEKALRVDARASPYSRIKLYGITEHGIAITESAHPDCKEFFVGKTNPGYIDHHITGQRVRISLTRQGWRDYVPGKILMVNNSERKNKAIPDAMVTRGDGRRVAIEIENNIKSKTRMAMSIAAHLSQILKNKYNFVYYYTPHLAALNRAFSTIIYVRMDGGWVKLSDSHRARFKTFDTLSLRKFDRTSSVIFDPTL